MKPPATGDRLPRAALGPFGRDDVERYATASGDSNPIHVDPAAAEAAGLTGPVVQGMLLAGHLVRIAEAWYADGTILAARAVFVRSVGLGESLTVDGRVVRVERQTPWSCTLRLIARNPQGAIAAVVETCLTGEPGPAGPGA